MLEKSDNLTKILNIIYNKYKEGDMYATRL